MMSVMDGKKLIEFPDLAVWVVLTTRTEVPAF